jgi:hypothetical protein
VELVQENQGYDGAEYSGKWGKYEVYEPEFNEPSVVGLPFFILVDKEKIRMSTEDESFEYLDTLPDTR